MAKKTYPTIEPMFLKNEKGKLTSVFLPYDVYESIFEEIKDLEQKIKQFDIQEKKKTSPKKSIKKRAA